MTNPAGSTWRRWDLHVHSPSSHAANYGGDAGWDRYLEELRALPPDMSVIGINDYLWVDGYERVLSEHSAGNLPNLEAIFPVVELRTSDFVGTTGHLQRLNLHATFAPGTPADLITSQFIMALSSHFTLADQYTHLAGQWNAVPTRAALADLGRLIKSTVPENQLKNYGSDFVEGFNNWAVRLADVKAAAASSAFRETPLLALGKTEWADIPWNDNTIATKKTLISSVQLLFTASENPSMFAKALSSLGSAGVNRRLLDCSDAHHFSDSDQKDRIGNCNTWICADPTLAGLKHALLEYDSRIYVGLKPDLLVHQESDPTNFISSISITPLDPGKRPSPSFDVDLPLNHGFVAIIGNKGSGKSALLDTIALASNSHAASDFTFLSKERYKSPKDNKALHYEVQISSADGTAGEKVPLSGSVDREIPERIRYLPQSLLERLCNKPPDSSVDPFEVELRSIIFSHVPEHQRLGCATLDELIDKRASALEHDISRRRTELESINDQIVEIEEQLRPSYVRSLRSSLSQMEEQLAAHDAARPPDPVMPASEPQEGANPLLDQIAALRERLVAIDTDEQAERLRYVTERDRLDAAVSLLREIGILRDAFAQFEANARLHAETLGLQLDDLAALRVDTSTVESAREMSAGVVRSLDSILSPDGDLARKRDEIRGEIAAAESELDGPRREYELKRRELEAWHSSRAQLVGSASEESTIEFYRDRISRTPQLAADLAALRISRLDSSSEIHALLALKVEMYRELYAPVQAFLEGAIEVEEEFSLEFSAGLEFENLAENLFGYIDRGATGTFHGREQSEAHLRGLTEVVHTMDWSSVSRLISELDLDLRFDRRSGSPGQPLDGAQDILRRGASLSEVYGYLFGLSYLEPRYEIRSLGRSISELSPGQKGTILLMFYLLVDQSRHPIALDQPDENLDNQTVHSLLRPAIRRAKRHRQVIVVTHSPNLAIVGDADQVIVAACDGTRFEYSSGSIEEPSVRDLVVEVLEGTWPAFNDRVDKYATTKPEQA